VLTHISYYERELQALKSWDEVQFTQKCERSGYPFITTAGHGYLAIPRDDARGQSIVSKMTVEYGFKGKLATYLEEDCEAPEFVKLMSGTNLAYTK